MCFSLSFVRSFRADKAEATTAATFAENCVADATANVATTDIYKKYEGRAGLIAWVKAIDCIEFQNFTPALLGTQGNKVYLMSTYTPKMKASGKAMGPQADVHEWTVDKEGKIASVKFFWGNQKDLADLWA